MRTKTRRLLTEVLELSREIVKANGKLLQIVRHDRICGAWVAERGDHAAVVAAMNAGYMASVYLRGGLTEQLFILPNGEALEINTRAGSKPVPVVFDPEGQTLSLGRYGLFRREREMPRAEADIDFMPEPPAGGAAFEELSAACHERKRKTGTTKPTN